MANAEEVCYSPPLIGGAGFTCGGRNPRLKSGFAGFREAFCIGLAPKKNETEAVW